MNGYEKLNEMVVALINNDTESARAALHDHIVEATKMSFDKKKGFIMGPVKDWLNAIEGTQADVDAAFNQAKDLDSFKELSSLVKFKSSPNHAKNGTFVFDLPDADKFSDAQKDQSYYNVSPFGQIRGKYGSGAVGGASHTRLKSEKPTVVAGKPVDTMVKNYDKAFKELIRKINNRK